MVVKKNKTKYLKYTSTNGKKGEQKKWYKLQQDYFMD